MMRILYIVLLTCWFGCGSPKSPGLWKSGEYSCEHCRMQIEDLRFKSAAITKKGKIISFDSIECLIGWMKENKLQIRNGFVTDFNNPKSWINLEKAFILKSNKRQSPMGAGLSAYLSKKELKDASVIAEGEQIILP